MIVRNPTPGEVEKAADIAWAAFGGEQVHWRQSFQTIAELYGERFILVVEIDGQLVSSLVCTPGPVYIGDAVVPHSAVGAVGTLPEARKRGSAGAMMTESVKLLRSEGIYLSSLWPFSYPYYRKFGWEVGAESRRYQTDAKVFSALGDPAKTRGAKEDDFQQIRAVYDAFARKHNCLTQRSETWWRRIIQPANVWQYTTEPGRGAIVHITNETIDGYAVYEIAIDEDRKRVEVGEMAFSDSRQRMDLLAGLAEIDPEARLIFYSTRNDMLMHQLPDPRLVSTTICPGFQFRVIDPPKALESLCPDKSVSGRLSFALSDSVFERFEFGVEFEGGRVGLCAPDRGALLKMSVETLARLYTGYLSPTDALALGMIEIQAGSEKTIHPAQRFFSQRPPYRSSVEPG
ncbi:MAG: GNAT family N-acetyltransferase [Armatimonadota bacterium]|nr:GNAT family N-acetyltransferase [bacterium]